MPQGRTKGECKPAAARAPTYKVRKDVTGIMENMVPVNSGVRILFAVWARAVTRFCECCPSPKSLKKFERALNYLLTCRGAHVSRADSDEIESNTMVCVAC